MANINDLKRQHKEIYEITSFLKLNMEENKVKQEAAKLSQSINILAGKLKMHLIAEDDYLYPKLLKGADFKAKETAEKFINEMGNLAQVFTEYKGKYNISPRILGDIDGFIKETKMIVDALENRMNREDRDLYILL
ncbi:MAG: hypothetical protein K0Q99_222 [Clostridia bacterium]|jgi:iron-sulfur cluster repair protein YtfE (RIC family)|nr:hypothetical protein [Clostridia bacterium]